MSNEESMNRWVGSKIPNLQNIPRHTLEGDALRKSMRRWLETPFTDCVKEFYGEYQ